ncbi:MAG: sulfotransferase [Acidiferrobacterales bacterium]
MAKHTSPIFVGGVGRSGTTLLRVILDSHSHIACGPEFKLIPGIIRQWEQMSQVCAGPLQPYGLSQRDINGIFRQFIESLVANYKTISGKRRIAEKTPGNVICFPQLNQIFPDSPLIHVIRDGRDVICSLLTMDWVTGNGKMSPHVESADSAAQYWVNTVQRGMAAARQPSASERYYEIRYEEIVSSPEKTLRSLFDFLDEPWESEVLNFYKVSRDLAGESSATQVSQPITTSAVARWKTDLSEADKKTVRRIAGPLLVQLGYAENNDWQ